VDIQSNSSKIINTPSMTIIPSITSSTIGPLTVNKTFPTEQLNITPTAITKSLLVNTTISMTTTLPNISSSTSRPDKLNPTMKVIFIPTPTLITKFAVENTSLTTSTSVYSSNSTVKPLIKYSTLSTTKLINSSSTMTKSITNNSPSTTALVNNSTQLSIQPSIPDSDEKLINKSINTQQTKQNTIINENKTMLNNSTTRLPSKYLNGSIVLDKNMIVFDISDRNPNLKPFEYNQTSNYIDSLNITTESDNLSDLGNTSIPFINEKPTKVLKVHLIPELNNLLHNQSTKNINDRLADSVKQDGEFIKNKICNK